MDTTIALLINGSLGLLGVVVGHFVTKHTYIDQRSYERKSDLITDLYKEVVRLEFELKKYLHFIGADLSGESLEEKRKSLSKIKSDFQLFQHKFWEVEIILDDDVIKTIQEFLTKYIQITSKLSVSNLVQQQGDTNYSFEQWDESFKLATSDLVKIKEDLKEEFKRALK